MRFSRKSQFDRKPLEIRSVFFLILCVIIVFALISYAMLYAAANGDAQPWALKQGVTFALFIPVMLLLRYLSLRTLYHTAYYVYYLCIISLLIAELLGHTTMGAQRWIRVGPINFQPSEFTKIGVILALARYFNHSLSTELQKLSFLVVPLLIVLLPAILILKQPNLGTTLILILISLSIYLVIGFNKWFFIIPGLALLASLPVIWQLLHDYQKRRVFIFLNPEHDLLGAGYNVAQSKIAIGAGGFLGRGFMAGTQNQLSFLPEKHTDFIFTLLAEEWGFLGCGCVLLLYTSLLAACYKIAFRTKDYFGKIIVIGVATTVFLHVFVNISMISGLLPVVGTPITFLSYGGSHLAAIMIGFGLVLSVERNSRKVRTF